MGTAKRRRQPVSRRALLFGGAMILLLIWAGGWLLYNNKIESNKQPVAYPPGWPLEFVTVPDGAWQGELSQITASGPGQYVWHTGWHTRNTWNGIDWKSREWAVGFDYGGTLDQACSDLEVELKQHGWLKLGSNNPVRRGFYSPDFCYSVSIIYYEGQSQFSLSSFSFTSQPDAWFLRISEYDPSIEDFPMPQQAVPIE